MRELVGQLVQEGRTIRRENRPPGQGSSRRPLAILRDTPELNGRDYDHVLIDEGGSRFACPEIVYAVQPCHRGCHPAR